MPITHPRAALNVLSRYGADVLIDIMPWPRMVPIVAALSGNSYLIGFRTPGRFRHWAFDTAIQHSADQHELENYRALLAPLGIRCEKLPRAPEGLRSVSSQLSAAGRPLLTFHPWASGFRSGLREWAVARWAELGRIALANGCDIAITGGPADAARTHQLANLLGASERVSARSGASLLTTAQTLAGSAAVVSVNTGVMHLTAALDRPLIALHGPTNPARWGPLSNNAIVLGPGVAEGGAYLNLGFEYPRNAADCMGKITVEEVWNSVSSILKVRAPIRDIRKSETKGPLMAMT
ncbi:MAG: glycosyltransferase family 9 protein [Acetobacteraceae bacterium]|nr:glycosyltransferase family 9 protein [Acetobacteraceae bacterium]